MAGAGVLLEVAMIAVRFLNIGLLSLKIGTFLIVVCPAVSTLTQVVQTICANNVGSCILLSLYVQDIVLSVVIVVGLTGAGILPVYVAVRWTDVVLSDNLPELRDIRNCLAATAVSCNNPTLQPHNLTHGCEYSLYYRLVVFWRQWCLLF